ncbi:AN1-type zinc finger protein 2A, partial [Termitomyces sp. J132]
SVTDNGTQLLSIGKQCSHPSCLLIDFLPFKCQHCQESFCQEHFKVAAHKCPKYDEGRFNRVAPDCPFCNTPVAVRPGQDPNDRMEDHIMKECPVMTGKTGRARTMPVCARANCNKVLFQPILCDICHNQFCPTHRFPTDHSCTPVSAPAPSTSRPRATNLFTGAKAKNLNSKATAAGVATLDAVKKAAASAKIATQGSKSGSSSAPVVSKPSSSSSHSLFSKTDRRAKAERESRLKAMRARAQKGLLSDEEKAILAAEEQAEKKDDCVVM